MNMDWFVYVIPPIDFRWGRLRTVRETLADLALKPDENTNFNDAPDIKEFINNWESAKMAAVEKGWDMDDHRNPPVVFWLPDDTEFSYGFVIKHDNNGDTFVVSPRKLAHLEETG